MGRGRPHRDKEIPERYLCEEQSRQRGVSSYTTFSRLAMRTQEPCATGHREPYASQSHATARQDAHSRHSPVILTLTGPLLHLRSSQHTPPHSLVSAHRSVLHVHVDVSTSVVSVW